MNPRRALELERAHRLRLERELRDAELRLRRVLELVNEADLAGEPWVSSNALVDVVDGSWQGVTWSE